MRNASPRRLAADLIIVARLAILVDVIAIASRIAIILASVNYGAGGAAEHATYGRTCSGAYSGNNGSSDAADAGPDQRSCAHSGNLTILSRSCAAAQRKTGRSSGRK